MPNYCDLGALEGFTCGQASDLVGKTGVTVLRFDAGAVAAVDVRGAAPGTRETDLLKPENLIDKVHAIVLSGGSVWGLDAMSGVVQVLEDSGVGFDTGVAKVPIVTGAVLFDLGVGSASIRPDMLMGRKAAEAATGRRIETGAVGAGCGATLGKIYGREYASASGLGVHCISLADGFCVAAIVAVNPYGEVFGHDGRLLGASTAPTALREAQHYSAAGNFPGTNTTIGAIVTNATLTKTEALKVAQMAHDGVARAIRPAHTLYDGDTLFAAATGAHGSMNLNRLGMLAADAVEGAIHNGVLSCQGEL
jgi:L-aminopeptidase/D-esterase-like protein